MNTSNGFTFEKFAHSGGDVVIFTVHGKTRLNVVGIDTLRECSAGVAALSDDPAIRRAVLQGGPHDAFIGGANLRELQALETHDAAGFVGAIHEFCDHLRAFPVPVIARIRGHCLGAGMEIAAACDFRVCDESAVFGMPEVRVGVPSVVEAALLPQLIGFGKTRELVFRGHLIDAEEASRIGFIEQQVGSGDIDDAVAQAVSDIIEAAPNAIRLQKRLCRDWEPRGVDEVITDSLATFAEAYETDEPRQYCERFFVRRSQASKA
jgi:enoyl-CoA hydratase/carnithine racemase